MQILNESEDSVFNTLSSSFLDDEHQSDVDISEIASNIQSILYTVFGSGIKTEVQQHSNRLTFACPYCGDSAKNPKKKRGNLFYDGFLYHCYNCGMWRSIHRVFSDFNNVLSLSTSEMMKYRLMHKITHKIYDGLSFVVNDKISKFSFSKKYLMEKFEFSAIKGTRGEVYLRNRYQYDLDKFAWDKYTSSVVIFNMDLDGNVIGFQKRILNKHVKNKYINYNLKQIYGELEEPITDDIEHINDISLIYGILTVDFNDTLTIFEGSFDSFLYPNSIATSTANKELPFNAENMQYWYDFDELGNKKAAEKLLDGYPVFLWKLWFSENNIDYDMIEKCDLTELYKLCKLYNIKTDFGKYFSKNRLDVVYL